MGAMRGGLQVLAVFGAMWAANEAGAALVARPGTHLRSHISGAGVAGIDFVSDSSLVAARYSSTLDLHRIALDTGPVGPAFYTQPAFATGLTFGGAAVATDGTFVLSGQTGSVPAGQLFPGRVFLTPLAGGASTEWNVPGNYDFAQGAGNFFLTAAAGAATGLVGDGSSGVYLLEQSGGTITGLNLVIDTGTASGLVAADSGGAVVFSLGGFSGLVPGGPNDLYRLTSAEVAQAAADGQTTGLPGSAADRLIAGTALKTAVTPLFQPYVPEGGYVSSYISDLLFDANGDIIIGMSGYVFDRPDAVWASRVVGAGLLLDVTTNGDDYAASVARLLYTNDTDGGGSLAYRSSDQTLWISASGDIYGLSLVPEPSMLALAGIGMLLGCRIGGRRGR